MSSRVDANENRARSSRDTAAELKHVTSTSASQWAKWMGITAATSVVGDFSLKKTWPAYSRLAPARRFFIWSLFCLSVSQFNLEDQEVEMMRDHNTKFREEALLAEQESQRKFVEELKKREAAAAANANK